MSVSFSLFRPGAMEEEWEKGDVLQSLNKLLQKEFGNLFRTDGLIFSSEFCGRDVVLVFSIPTDRMSESRGPSELLFGPFQIVFSLKSDDSTTDTLISDEKLNYLLTFRLMTYHGKVLSEDVSSLIFDPETRLIQVSESVFQILKKMNCFVADSDEGSFHLCSGVSKNKNLRVEQILIEFSNSSNIDDVTFRGRFCTYLVEFGILFSGDVADNVSAEQCRGCSELELQMSGLDRLKQLPPGIAIQPSGANPVKVPAKKETGCPSGVVVLKNGQPTSVPLPKLMKPTAAPAKPAPPVRAAAVSRKRTVEDIPVMTESDLGGDFDAEVIMRKNFVMQVHEIGHVQ